MTTAERVQYLLLKYEGQTYIDQFFDEQPA